MGSGSSLPGADGIRRILVVDDTPSIHDDFRKILCRKQRTNAALAAEALFGVKKSNGSSERPAPAAGNLRRPELDEFVVDSALQGREGYEMVMRMVKSGTPYALVFVDMRMPPGWDGVETLCRIFEVDPNIEAVVCTAFSDYSAMAIRRLSRPDIRLLTKPFDSRDVLDLAWSLTGRWQKRRERTGSMRPGGGS